MTEQVKLFIHMWKHHYPRRKRPHLRHTWERLAALAVLGQLSWGQVAGPVAATVLTLHGLNFDVTQFLKWRSPDGATFNPVKIADGSLGPLLHAVRQVAEKQIWQSAARRPMGRGLEDGAPSMEPAMKARCQFVQQDLPDHVKALDLVVCGGAWGPSATCTCRCGRHDVSTWHFYWGCPDLKQSIDPAIVDTQPFEELISKDPELRHAECLWARALVPASVYGQVAAPSATRSWRSPSFDQLVRQEAAIYPDGSGGPAWAPRPCKRAGAGCASILMDLACTDVPAVAAFGLATAGVVGRQPVPRAELTAIQLAVEAARPGQQLPAHPDAVYTVKGFSQQAEGYQVKLTTGLNGDLWGETYSTCDERHVAVCPTKLPAHVSTNAVVEGDAIEPARFVGNLVADTLAGVAAEEELSQLGVNFKRARLWEARTQGIARRLAHLEVERWKSTPHLVDALEPLSAHVPFDPVQVDMTLKAQLHATGHQLVQQGGQLACMLCRHRSRKGLQHWLKHPCPQASKVVQPPPPPEPLHRPVSQTRVQTDPLLPKVTKAAKRRAVHEQHAVLKQRRLLDQQVARQVAHVRELGTPTAVPMYYDITSSLPPVRVHASHALLVVGGYAGCIRCCGVAGFSPKLESECARTCPAGSHGPMRLLARGALPRVQKQVNGDLTGLSWPSGETCPAVRR